MRGICFELRDGLGVCVFGWEVWFRNRREFVCWVGRYVYDVRRELGREGFGSVAP